MWLATNKKFKNMCALEMSYKPDLSHADLVADDQITWETSYNY